MIIVVPDNMYIVAAWLRNGSLFPSSFFFSSSCFCCLFPARLLYSSLLSLVEQCPNIVLPCFFLASQIPCSFTHCNLAL